VLAGQAHGQLVLVLVEEGLQAVLDPDALDGWSGSPGWKVFRAAATPWPTSASVEWGTWPRASPVAGEERGSKAPPGTGLLVLAAYREVQPSILVISLEASKPTPQWPMGRYGFNMRY